MSNRKHLEVMRNAFEPMTIISLYTARQLLRCSHTRAGVILRAEGVYPVAIKGFKPYYRLEDVDRAAATLFERRQKRGGAR